MVKFKVGDKVRILHARGIEACVAKDGDVLKVVALDSVGIPRLLDVDGDVLAMHDYELRHIELVSASQSETQRITTLENEIKALTSRITALEKTKPQAVTIESHTFTTAQGTDVKKIAESLAKLIKPQTPNQRRKAVIERAKAFVEDVEKGALDPDDRNDDLGNGNRLYEVHTTKPEYHVNKEKRVVTVLIKGANYGKVMGRAIARCSPDDVFNVHIGKAIALAKAYGLEVPREFTHAPQPEPAIGQRIEAKRGPFSNGERTVYGVEGTKVYTQEKRRGWFTKDATQVIDDSEAQYDE